MSKRVGNIENKSSDSNYEEKKIPLRKKMLTETQLKKKDVSNSGSASTKNSPKRKPQKCQKCLKHDNKEFIKRGHKRFCKHRNCKCSEICMKIIGTQCEYAKKNKVRRAREQDETHTLKEGELKPDKNVHIVRKKNIASHETPPSSSSSFTKLNFLTAYLKSKQNDSTDNQTPTGNCVITNIN